MNTHNNYEPTSRVNYERTTPNPYLHDTYLPPPPPEYYMHQRTGKAWKVALPMVLLLLGVVVGVLAYPTINGMINPSSLTSKPTPYVPFGMPAVTPTLNTDQAMDSSDFSLFIRAFAQAMTNKQYDIIKRHTDTNNFQGIVLYSDGGYGTWQNTYDRLTAGSLSFTVEYPIITAKQAGYGCVGYSQHGIPYLMKIDAQDVEYVVGTASEPNSPDGQTLQVAPDATVFIFEIPTGPAVFYLWRGYTLNNVKNCNA